MKVFISWSGKRGQCFAEALREWLLYVLQGIEPWMSAADIPPGARWGAEIMQQLRETKFGIVCVTRESVNASWLLFEVGVLAQALDRSSICPLLVDLDPAELSGPLVLFQAVKAERESLWTLVRTIHQLMDERTRRLSQQQLRTVFDRFWPDLQRAIADLPSLEAKERPTRSDRAILEEVLETVRGLTRVAGQTKSSVRSEQGAIQAVIDVSAAVGREKTVRYIWDHAQVTFQELLNRIWSEFLLEKVPPFTYGKTWNLIHSAEGGVIEKAASRDDRLLQDIGIGRHTPLRLVLLNNDDASDKAKGAAQITEDPDN